MMKLTVFVLTLLASINAAQAQTAQADGIDDLEGTWTYYANPALGTYVCTWVSGHNFSCTVSASYGGGTCHATYATTLSGAGSWTYTATYNSGTCPGTTWSSSVVASNLAFCDLEFFPTCTPGSYVDIRTTGANSTPETNGGHTTQIEVPGTIGTHASSAGENATVDKGAYPGTGSDPLVGENFSATLKDPGNAHHNFAGYLPHELLAILDNTCNLASVGAGGFWTTDQTNNYSVGNANYGSGDVTEYDTIADRASWILDNQRSYRVLLPCTLTYDQQMTIALPNDNGAITWVYEDHDLVHKLGDGWIKETRNGVGTQRNFGQKRSVWRWADWTTYCLSVTSTFRCM